MNYQTNSANPRVCSSEKESIEGKKFTSSQGSCKGSRSDNGTHVLLEQFCFSSVRRHGIKYSYFPYRARQFVHLLSGMQRSFPVAVIMHKEGRIGIHRLEGQEDLWMLHEPLTADSTLTDAQFGLPPYKRSTIKERGKGRKTKGDEVRVETTESKPNCFVAALHCCASVKKDDKMGFYRSLYHTVFWYLSRTTTLKFVYYC